MSPAYLLKAYSLDERILYGTGKIVSKEDILAYSDHLLAGLEAAFVDLRSATNNCWQVRFFSDI